MKVRHLTFLSTDVHANHCASGLVIDAERFADEDRFADAAMGAGRRFACVTTVAVFTLMDNHMSVGEESPMSGDVKGNLLGADESECQDEEVGFEDEEWSDAPDLDLTEADLALIGAIRSRHRPL